MGGVPPPPPLCGEVVSGGYGDIESACFHRSSAGGVSGGAAYRGGGGVMAVSVEGTARWRWLFGGVFFEEK